MKKLDKEIRKKAKLAQCPISREYENRIEFLLNSLSRKEIEPMKKNARRFTPLKAALTACGLCIGVCVAIPVAAKVNSLVAQRMQNMSEEETEEYLEANEQENMTREHDTEALRHSRELSTEEEARYDKLLEKYMEEGVFPQGELQKVDKLEGDIKIDAPVYETWNREIYLPERELTDEELLQMIDFSEKSAYVVSHTDEAQEIIKEQQEFNENPNPKENDMSEEEAIEKASAYLEIVCGVDASSMDKSIVYDMGMGVIRYGEYQVTFKDDNGKSYSVDVAGEKGEFTGIWFYEDEEGLFAKEWSETAVNEELFQSVYQKAKNVLEGIFPDEKVVCAAYGYTKDENGNSKFGDVQYDLILENGYQYSFRYCIEKDTFVHIFLASDSGDCQGLLNAAGAWGDYIVTPIE